MFDYTRSPRGGRLRLERGPLAFATAAGGHTLTNGVVERTHSILMRASGSAKVDIYKTIKGMIEANRMFDKFDDINP